MKNYGFLNCWFDKRISTWEVRKIQILANPCKLCMWKIDLNFENFNIFNLNYHVWSKSMREKISIFRYLLLRTGLTTLLQQSSTGMCTWPLQWLQTSFVWLSRQGLCPLSSNLMSLEWIHPKNIQLILCSVQCFIEIVSVCNVWIFIYF